AIVGDLDGDALCSGAHCNRDGSALPARVAMGDAVGDELGGQEGDPFDAGMTAPEYLLDKGASHRHLLRHAIDDQPVWPFVIIGQLVAETLPGAASRNVRKRS